MNNYISSYRVLAKHFLPHAVVWLCLLHGTGISAQPGTTDFFAAARKSHEPIRLVDTDAVLRDASWSPDGQWIAFGSWESGNDDIWIRKARGGERIQITFDEAVDSYATWSPDGNQLLWASDRGGTTNLWAKNPWSEEPARKITSDADSLIDVGFSISSFSPDGSRIAYSSHRNQNEDIWTIHLKSGDTQRITTHADRDVIPHSWAPDGSEIAFSSNRNKPDQGGWDVWVVNIATGEERQLSQHEGWAWCPAWSHDGRTIVYSQAQSSGGGVKIYATTPDGKHTRKILDKPFFYGVVPHWIPGDSLLTFNGGYRAPRLFRVKVGPDDATELSIGDDVIQLQLAESKERAAVVTINGDQVIINDLNLTQHKPSARKIRGFSVSEWLGADMRWSPDEHTILLRLVNAGGRHALHLLEVQRGALEKLTTAAEIQLGGKSWSPSGKKIAYVATTSEDSKDIFTISLRGRKQRQITFDGVGPRGYGWSPDGRHLVYASKQAGQTNWNLYSIPASRGQSKLLLDWENSDETNPLYSPDGKYLAFQSDKDGQQAIWIMEIESGSVKKIWDDGGGFVWEPDSKGIAFGHRGRVYHYSIDSTETREMYRGKSWTQPQGWSSTLGLLLQGNHGADIWLMSAPDPQPEI